MSHRYRQLKRQRRRRYIRMQPFRQIYDAIVKGKMSPPDINTVEDAKARLAAIRDKLENHPYLGGFEWPLTQYCWQPKNFRRQGVIWLCDNPNKYTGIHEGPPPINETRKQTR